MTIPRVMLIPEGITIAITMMTVQKQITHVFQ